MNYNRYRLTAFGRPPANHGMPSGHRPRRRGLPDEVRAHDSRGPSPCGCTAQGSKLLLESGSSRLQLASAGLLYRLVSRPLERLRVLPGRSQHTMRSYRLIRKSERVREQPKKKKKKQSRQSRRSSQRRKPRKVQALTRTRPQI